MLTRDELMSGGPRRNAERRAAPTYGEQHGAQVAARGYGVSSWPKCAAAGVPNCVRP